jgi:hypothetical protein
MDDENSVLRWGGLAGVLGGVVFILVFAVVAAFAGIDPADPDAAVRRFPDIRVARTVEDGLYLLVLILWVAHFLALYRALRASSPAPALFGSSVAIVGLGVLAAGALPHIVSIAISDLYEEPDATDAERAMLAVAWATAQGVFDALFAAGLIVIEAGVLLLGLAILRAPAFGKNHGIASISLGVLGLVGGAAGLVEPDSPLAVLAVFGLIIFHLAVGWRLYGLPRLPSPV